MNQHFVPRTYLKHFAEKKGKQYYVDVFDKKEKKIFNININKICSERNIYTLDKNSKIASDPLALENVFARGFEPMYEKAYDILTNDSIYRISDVQRVEILIAIFQLFVRNPKILTTSITYHTTEIVKRCSFAKQNAIKGITYLDEDFSFKDWTEESIVEYFKNLTIKVFKEGQAFGLGKLGTFHEFSKFEVTKIIGNPQFLTCDNPIAIDDPITRNDEPFLKSKEFNIPLNAKYSLKIFHDNTLELNTINRLPTASGNVAINNSMIFDQSSRFIIGNKKAIEDYFIMYEFLSKPNLALKIDAMNQIVSNFPINGDTTEPTKIMEEYLDIYNQKGTLSQIEEYQLQQKLREQTIKWKKKRL
jgi:hypothetical protein